LGFKTQVAESGAHALAILETQQIDIVLADVRLAEVGDLRLAKIIRQRYPGIDVVLMTDATARRPAPAPTPGAYDGYLTKPFRVDEIQPLFEGLVEKQKLTAENRLLHEQLKTRQGFASLIGTSTKMQDVYRRVLKVAAKRHPVLILGESGTGKELVARAIHSYGPWRSRPFVPVDCGALSPTLVESELFGHVRGAFTGATEARQGLLAVAAGGTVFLDEIGELPVELQAKLLRALQEREIKPIGSNTRLPLEGRIIAATNQDPETAIKRGAFRKDLYFRLNVVSIKLPPLRERKNDLPILIHHFIDRHGGAQSRITGVSYDAMTRLMNYDWPGNVRELENSIQRALALGSPPLIQVKDLPSPVLNYFGPAAGGQEIVTLEDLERRAILQTLEFADGDPLRTAKLLGIGKTTIYRKLKEFGKAMPSEGSVANTLRFSPDDETPAGFGRETRPAGIDIPSIHTMMAKGEEGEAELLRYYNIAMAAINILYDAAAAKSQGARKVLADMADKLNARAGHWDRMKHARRMEVENLNEKPRE
jgi:two-component system response regulator HydG